MRNGKLLFQYDLGLGPAFIESPDVYNDGRWHEVQAKRHRQKGELIIDKKRKYSILRFILPVKDRSITFVTPFRCVTSQSYGNNPIV